MSKLLVMTPEKLKELRDFFYRNQGEAHYRRVRAAMTEVDVGDLVEMLHAWRWEQEHGTRELRPFSDYILDRIKEDK